MQRLRVDVSGCVQGVGFRPFVLTLARALDLCGWVQNTGLGVRFEIQGVRIKEFMTSFQAKLPPLARVDRLHQSFIDCLECSEFIIKASSVNEGCPQVPADTAICRACIQDVFDEQSRFYQYPFTSCTHCGPRMSAVSSSPYDRHNTAFADFPLCAPCLKEYKNPHDRRFHAQTMACNACGPCLSHEVADIAKALIKGACVAVKGIGGVHFITDARNERAIRTLRQAKQRPAKPLALMALNIQCVMKHCELDVMERELIEDTSRPIVLLKKKKGKPADDIAPGLNQWGLMLPYTAFHYLLFYHLLGQPEGADWLKEANELLLVVTSANEPGAPTLLETSAHLHQHASLLVTHNRKIVHRMDDSVVQAISGQKVFIRRARGFVPTPISLSKTLPKVLALGSLLKNTLCFNRGREAYLSHPHGDLHGLDSIQWAQESIDNLHRLHGFEPEIIAIDKHPAHPLKAWAKDQACPLIEVQHHHAHIAQVMGEQGLDGPVLGLAVDGFGLGEDLSGWGGELLLCQQGAYERVDSLRPLALPGGDKAAIDCWRMACSVIGASERLPAHLRKFPIAAIMEMIQKGINTPMSSSLGRLFDAASSILDVCQVNTYESEAPMRLQSQVTSVEVYKKGWDFSEEGLCFRALFNYLLECTPTRGANAFHGTLIAALSAWLCDNARQLGVKHIALAGGCFHNSILAQGILMNLSKEPVRCHLSSMPNDSGLSLGQLWVAGHKGRDLCV